jgi:RHS repeat-associated protein
VRGAWEEYWYDALGRRVLVRRRLEYPLCIGSLYCYSTIERVVWDGDQILAEVRQPGAGGENLDLPPNLGGSPYQQYGRVLYTQGPGIDAPLDGIRMEYNGTTKLLRPHANWRGTYDAATDSTGAQFGCTPIWYSGCADLGWTTEYKSYLDGPQLTVAPEWFGSLLRDKRDMSGLMYMRNRYYDPNTGKFTQQDPIGLAGGLNLYGFANGDPINFSDPFGLCPPEDDNFDDCEPGSSGWYAHRIATGEGSRLLNQFGGVLASCSESDRCMTALVGAWGAGGRSPGLTTQKVTSVNQMNKAIQRGQAPRGIKRVDKGKVKDEQDNVHFDDGSALNRDGTWKHGGRELTRAQREWLERGGFRAPGS